MRNVTTLRYFNWFEMNRSLTSKTYPYLQMPQEVKSHFLVSFLKTVKTRGLVGLRYSLLISRYSGSIHSIWFVLEGEKKMRSFQRKIPRIPLGEGQFANGRCQKKRVLGWGGWSFEVELRRSLRKITEGDTVLYCLTPTTTVSNSTYSNSVTEGYR